MRAPQFGKVRDGNRRIETEIDMPLGPLVRFLARSAAEADAQTALEGEIERRKRFNERLSDVKPASRPSADEAHEAEADR